MAKSHSGVINCKPFPKRLSFFISIVSEWKPQFFKGMRKIISFFWVASVQFSPSVISNSLQPHGLQHARPPCPSPTPGVYSNSCPLRKWCHPTISSSIILFSSRLQSFPALGSFQMSQHFTSGGQSVATYSFYNMKTPLTPSLNI